MNALRVLLKARLLRGLMGGSRFWAVAGLVVGARKLSRRLKDDQPKLVFREELKPGQSLLLTHVADAPDHGRGVKRR